MVMHARKTQRLSDGYFEKQQAHPYQNSKYGSKSASGERYSRGGGSDSPNGNAYRSDSGDSESPRDGRDRDRSYTNKGSYLQKIREKERENRDYKSSRDKYSDCVRSPKEKRSRDSEHRTNHDRSSDHDKSVLHPIKLTSTQNSRDRKLSHNCQEKREEREQRVSRVGDWSEHVSSSGKKYYYNCKTEVSQWEKPREWIERERERERSARERQKEHRDRDRDSDTRSSYGSSSRTGRSPIGDASASGTRTKAFLRSAAHEKHSNARAGGGGGSGLKGATVSSVRQWPGSGNGRGDAVESDRTPSATDATTSVEPVRRRPDASDAQDMDISPGDGTPTSEGSRDAPADPVPRPTGTPPAVPPPGHAPGPPGIATAASIPSGPSIPIPGAPRPAAQTPNHKDVAQPVAGSSVGQPLKIETGHVCVADGPPTPTHSEGQDCGDTRKLNSPPSSLSSLGALRPQGPSLTPSLANHYRDDLVNHVRGWPAEILEKQAQKLIEEAHILGSLQCTKVSADLKIARSLVRLTEIQATLQEQRILFLRQQIKMLEELKSQNSFMSDDS